MHSKHVINKHQIRFLAVLFIFGLLSINLYAQNNKTDIQLSSSAQDAINNGVTLTFNCELAIIEHFLFIDIKRNKKHYSFTIARHALSNSYMVKKGDLERPQMFRSLLEAINYITSESITLLGSYTKTNKLGEMRLALNKFELPGPMRLQAFISDDWDIDTGWVKWESES